MGAYVLRRLLLMIPTIVGIMAISFTVIQFAPGGPVEQVIAQLTGDAGRTGFPAVAATSGSRSPMIRFEGTAARRGSIPNSSRSWKSSSASTSRLSASAR
jgi:ABC-type microcin C transport system permease subunit YejB